MPKKVPRSIKPCRYFLGLLWGHDFVLDINHLQHGILFDMMVIVFLPTFFLQQIYIRYLQSRLSLLSCCFWFVVLIETPVMVLPFFCCRINYGIGKTLSIVFVAIFIWLWLLYVLIPLGQKRCHFLSCQLTCVLLCLFCFSSWSYFPSFSTTVT